MFKAGRMFMSIGLAASGFFIVSASLWQNDFSLYKSRPYKIGDIITIVLDTSSNQNFSTKSESQKNSNTDIKPFGKKAALPKGVTKKGANISKKEQKVTKSPLGQQKQAPENINENDPLTVFPYLPAFKYTYNTKSAQDVKGESQTSFKTVLAAVVKKVNENKTLSLEAKNSININGKVQIVLIRGVVNQRDIHNNEIRSERIADFSLTVNSTSLAAQATVTKKDLPPDLQKLSPGKLRILLKYLNKVTENIYK